MAFKPDYFTFNLFKMHDIDRTMEELEFEDAYEFEDDYEFEFEDDYEFEDEFDDEMYEFEDYEMESEYDYGMPFSEETEMELATELLSVSSEEELDQFLGKLIRKIGRGAKRLFRSKTFRKIGGFLKGIAKKVLPIAGGAIGGMFGMPTVGAGLGNIASNLFEMELEGLSPEDQEFEVARRTVRFMGATAKKMAKISPKVPPRTALKIAAKSAAKKHAPGLLRKKGKRLSSGRKLKGSWIRKGNKIILLGA